jgi:formate dehydrogenase major subunit
MQRLGVEANDFVTIESRRGVVSAVARRDPGIPHGAVFMPFAFVEAAANLLTNPALDPFGKIPEFKYCAVRVSKGAEVAAQAGYGVASEANS